MDFLFSFLERFMGDDTDPIDLLPLVVLAFLLVGVNHLRALLLKVLLELGALRERITIKGEIQGIRDDLRERHRERRDE